MLKSSKIISPIKASETKSLSSSEESVKECDSEEVKTNSKISPSERLHNSFKDSSSSFSNEKLDTVNISITKVNDCDIKNIKLNYSDLIEKTRRSSKYNYNDVDDQYYSKLKSNLATRSRGAYQRITSARPQILNSNKFKQINPHALNTFKEEPKGCKPTSAKTRNTQDLKVASKVDLSLFERINTHKQPMRSYRASKIAESTMSSSNRIMSAATNNSRKFSYLSETSRVHYNEMREDRFKQRLKSQENIKTMKSNAFESSKSFLQNIQEVKSIVEKCDQNVKKNNTVSVNKDKVNHLSLAIKNFTRKITGNMDLLC